jgi:hypothetical protein
MDKLLWSTNKNESYFLLNFIVKHYILCIFVLRSKFSFMISKVKISSKLLLIGYLVVGWHFNVYVACDVGPSVNPLQNRELNMWTLFCSVCINFLNSQIWKDIMLESNGKPSSVTTLSTDYSFQNLFFWNLFEFSVLKII